MAETAGPGDSGAASQPRIGRRFIRWGGLAAAAGPLLVLVANIYLLWAEQTYGAGPAGIVEAATTILHVAFGGIRLLGGTLLIFGLIALYAVQLDSAGYLGLIGFVVSMTGSVLLTGQAWFITFFVPAMATDVPTFLEAAMGGGAGPLVGIGGLLPILLQAIGWTIFGIATYRADVFPRWAAIALTIGAVLLFIPVTGLPFVFQLAVASLGFLLFTGRVPTHQVEPATDRVPSGHS